MSVKLIKLFLRYSVAIGFLSAVADRFGFWPASRSAWGNWEAFLSYTASLNPWFPESFIPFVAVLSTVAEVLFGLGLIVGYKTRLFANLSGILLLLFALSMSFTVGIKKVFDFSVFAASAAAFSIALIKERVIELDAWIKSGK